MDEMDMFLSADTDQTDRALKMAGSFSLSPKHARRQGPVVTKPSLEPPLKFHLVTSDKSEGYHMMFSHRRIGHLRRLLQESGLITLTVEQVCHVVLAGASDNGESEPRLPKQQFDSAMGTILRRKPNVSTETANSMIALLDSLYACFDREGNTKPSATEVACGISIFCQGKKSDKLEHAFELLDQKHRGKLSKREMNKYFQSFLTVLLGIAICPCLESDPDIDSLQTFRGEQVERSPTTVARAAKAGAEWATSLIFRELQKSNNSFVTFDDFAAWYTTRGHGNMPWLELIDLRKWVLLV
jgi:hypothetical protein